MFITVSKKDLWYIKECLGCPRKFLRMIIYLDQHGQDFSKPLLIGSIILFRMMHWETMLLKMQLCWAEHISMIGGSSFA